MKVNVIGKDDQVEEVTGIVNMHLKTHFEENVLFSKNIEIARERINHSLGNLLMAAKVHEETLSLSKKMGGTCEA